MFRGELFLVYLGGYGFGRFWIEGLRTDQLLLPVIGWPVSRVLAGILAVASVIIIVRTRKNIQRRKTMHKHKKRTPEREGKASDKEDNMD